LLKKINKKYRDIHNPYIYDKRLSYMNIPGFTAGESVYNTNAKYGFNTSATDNLDVEKIVPQGRRLTSIDIERQDDGKTYCYTANFEDDDKQVSYQEFIGCFVPR
jgi:hypothetical protein